MAPEYGEIVSMRLVVSFGSASTIETWLLLLLLAPASGSSTAIRTTKKTHKMKQTEVKTAFWNVGMVKLIFHCSRLNFSIVVA